MRRVGMVALAVTALLITILIGSWTVSANEPIGGGTVTLTRQWRTGIITKGAGEGGIVVTDLDGDGITDIATCAGIYGAPYVLNADGAGYTPRWYGEAIGCSRVAVGNRNGDGIQELYVAGKVRNPNGTEIARVWIYEGDDFTLADTLTLPLSDTITGLVVGNADTDGAIELIVTQAGGTRVYNAATLALEWNATAYGGTEAVLGEFDGTPNPDLIVNGTPAYQLDVATQSLQATIPEGYGIDIALDDVDNDGRDELVGLKNFGGPLSLYVLNGENSSILWQDASYGYGSVGTGDTTGDGVPEVFAGSESYSKVYGYNGATGTFLWTLDRVFGNATQAIASGDLDNDGNLEVVWGLEGDCCSGGYGLVIGNPATQTIEWDAPDWDGPLQTAGGDLDGDGTGELVVVTRNSNGYGYSGSIITVYDGTDYTEEWQTTLTDNFINIRRVAIGQVDADPAREIILMGLGGVERARIFVYDGVTHQLEWSSAPLGNEYNFVELLVRNLDQEPRDEIILALSYGSMAQSRILIMNGASNVLDWDSGILLNDVRDIALGDGDGDGTPELAIAATTMVSVYEAGTWLTPFTRTIPPSDLVTVAFTNPDLAGASDLLVARSSNNNSVLEAWNGAATYAVRWSQPLSESNIYDLHAGDYDYDGTEEFVVAGTTGYLGGPINLPSLLWVGVAGTTGYTIEAESNNYSGGIYGVTRADVDGDGTQELLFGTDFVVEVDQLAPPGTGPTPTPTGSATATLPPTPTRVPTGTTTPTRTPPPAPTMTATPPPGALWMEPLWTQSRWEQYGRANSPIIVNLDQNNPTQDIIGCNGLAAYALRSYNAGSTYQSRWVSELHGCSGIAVGDGDGDQYNDIYVLFIGYANGQSNHTIRRYSGRDFNLLNQIVVPGESNESGIAVANVDNDGDLELVFTRADGTWVFHAGTLSLEWQATGKGGTGVRVGDVDGDNQPEIVVNGNQARILSAITQSQESGYAGGFGVDYEVGDVDGDGVDEIVYLTRTNDEGMLNVYNLDTDSFQWQQGPRGFKSVSLGDSTGDGILEIITYNTTIDKIVGLSGVNGNQLWTTGEPAAAVFSVGDTDNDGQAEVVWSTNPIDGSFGEGWLGVSAVGGTAPEWESGSEAESGFVLSGDLDRDGTTELIGVRKGYYDSLITISVHDGATYTFERAMTPSLGGFFDLTDAAIGQADSDPAPEIILSVMHLYDVKLWSIDGVTGETEWLSGTLDEFVPGADLRVTNIDTDPLDELIVVANGRVSIFNGASNVIQWESPLLDAVSVKVGDADGDGTPDLAAGGRSLTLYEVGTWTETISETYPFGEGIQHLVFAKAQGTTRTDLLADFYRKSGSTLDFINSATLDPLWSLPYTNTAINDLTTTDLDYDGRTEAVIAGEIGEYGFNSLLRIGEVSTTGFTVEYDNSEIRGAIRNVVFPDADDDGTRELFFGGAIVQLNRLLPPGTGPTPTPTPTGSATATPTVTRTPTATYTPTHTATATATAIVPNTPTATATPIVPNTPTATATPIVPITPTATASATPTNPVPTDRTLFLPLIRR